MIPSNVIPFSKKRKSTIQGIIADGPRKGQRISGIVPLGFAMRTTRDPEDFVAQQHNDRIADNYQRLSDSEWEKANPALFQKLLKSTAKLEDIPQSAVLAEVKARRSRKHNVLKPSAVNVGTVNGRELLNDMRTAIDKHLVAPSGGSVAMTLWAVHVHAFGAARHSARLAFVAPVENSGKSTGLKVLYRLCPNATTPQSWTAAAFKRRITAEHPLMLMDDAEHYMDTRDFWKLLDGGYDFETAKTSLSDIDPQGNYYPAEYSTWAPVAFARVGAIPIPQLRSRCIILNMQRALPNEQPLDISKTSEAAWAALKGRAAWWAHENIDRLRDAEPNMGGLINRQAQLWKPLFAIADAVGGEWPKLARRAAEQLAEGREISKLEDLLAAIDRAFDKRDVLGSLELCRILAADDEFDAAAEFEIFNVDAGNDRGAGRKLNKELKLLKIKSGPLAELKASRGFRQEWFKDAFARYVENKH